MIMYFYRYQLMFVLVALASGSSEIRDNVSNVEDKDKCHCSGGVDCDQTTGVCPTSECDPGWQGDSCRYVCSTGSYGQNCDSTCTQCKSAHCEHLHGTCLGDCVDGWGGLYCNEAMNTTVTADEKMDVPIVLMTVGVVVAVILIILGSVTTFICYRKQKRKRLRRIGKECNTDQAVQRSDSTLDVAYNAVKAVECQVNVDRTGTTTFKDNKIDGDRFNNHHPDQVTEL